MIKNKTSKTIKAKEIANILLALICLVNIIGIPKVDAAAPVTAVRFLAPRGSQEWRLLKAVKKNDIAEVRRLLAVVRNINAVDKLGYTALHLAAFYGYKEITQSLLAIPGVKVNALNSFYETPLHRASELGNFEVVPLLLAALPIETDVNIRNQFGMTALHFGARYVHEAVVQLLLSAKGIDVNIESVCNCTALDLAIIHGNNAREEGNTEMAEKYDRIMDILRSAGARTGEELARARQGSCCEVM